jgi:hypothetical protein
MHPGTLTGGGGDRLGTLPRVTSTAAAPGLKVLGLRVIGVVVPTWLAAVTALVETFLVPLAVGAVHVPIALILAVVLNALIARWAIWAGQSLLAAVPPAVAWIVVVLLFSGGRAEGDLAIPADNWVGLLLMLVGPAAFAVVVYQALLRAPRRLHPPEADATPEAEVTTDAVGDAEPTVEPADDATPEEIGEPAAEDEIGEPAAEDETDEPAAEDETDEPVAEAGDEADEADEPVSLVKRAEKTSLVKAGADADGS